MRDDRYTLLKQLVDAPSPSGYEGPARAVWRRAVESVADDVRTDLLGNTIACVNPSGKPRVMLAGHIDEIGLMVTYIDDDGFVYFAAIGGHDPVVLPGQRVQIHTASGPLLGAIGRRPFHFMTRSERDQQVELKDLWIDVGARTRDELANRVDRGDPITLAVGMERLQNDRVVSRALDNKMGAFVAVETIRQVAERRPRAAVYAVATVQEEVGLRGAQTSAFAVDPTVAIAIDVAHGVDHPGAAGDKKRYSDISIGGGPAIQRGPNNSPVVAARLVAAAKAANVPYQIEAEPDPTGTDAGVIQVSRSGVATGIISVPLRYMHTPVEILELSDVDHTIDLLTEFIIAIDSDTDFTP